MVVLANRTPISRGIGYVRVAPLAYSAGDVSNKLMHPEHLHHFHADHHRRRSLHPQILLGLMRGR
jgi:hypothetical protein